MQSNSSSKCPSKAPRRSVRSFVQRIKKKDAENEYPPLLGPEEIDVSPPESPILFAPTDNGNYYVPANR